MKIAAAVVLVCLLLYFFIKYLTLKGQIKSFTRQVEALKDEDYCRGIRVDSFDKDIVGLAVALDEHTEIQRSIRAEYADSRERLGNIISGISHDFRTPLTASLGYLQLIEKSGELSEKNAEYLGIATERNRYLKELSDEFFELTKLENSNESADVEAINLSNLISDAAAEQYDWIEQRGILPEIDISDGIIIEGCRRYVMRIVDNIFSNAQKYALGKLSVSLSQADGKAVLTASNDSEELDGIDVSRVFDPFYKSSSRSKSGSGLGLYVVKCLCEKLSAKVSAEVYENDDERAEFKVTIIFDIDKKTAV